MPDLSQDGSKSPSKHLMYFSIKDLRSRVNRESNFKSSESQDVFHTRKIRLRSLTKKLSHGAKLYIDDVMTEVFYCL